MYIVKYKNQYRKLSEEFKRFYTWQQKQKWETEIRKLVKNILSLAVYFTFLEG